MTPREPNPEAEALAALYAQCAQIYLHFTGWRDRLFAGYFALQGGFAVALGSIAERPNLHDWAWTVTLANFFMSVVFLLLGDRIYPLFTGAQEAASALEKQIAKSTSPIGVFGRFEFDRTERGKSLNPLPPTHGAIIWWMCALVGLANFCATVYLAARFPLQLDPVGLSDSVIASVVIAALLLWGAYLIRRKGRDATKKIAAQWGEQLSNATLNGSQQPATDSTTSSSSQ